MSRRTILAPAVAVVVCLLVALTIGVRSVADAQERVGNDDVPTGVTSRYADVRLIGVLTSAGLIDEWVDASALSPEAAVVKVSDASYVAAQQEFLADIDRFVERREHLEDRDAQIDELLQGVAVLEAVARDLRRSAVAGSRQATSSLTPAEAAEAWQQLATVVGKQRWVGVSLDPLVLVEHRLVDTRDELIREVEAMTRSGESNSKRVDAPIVRLSALQSDLQRARSLLAGVRQAAMPSRFGLAATRAALIDEMPALHDRRPLLATVVGGLPVVTFDAYVRAASVLDASCPVEWNLLAGIGSVESFHGTIGDAQVQASGRVSNPILGPLLDGGATAREAARAAADAEAAAEAALTAEEAGEAAAAPDFDAAVWGEEAVEQATPPDPADVSDRLHDPLLWGDELPFDEDVDGGDDGDDGEGDDVDEGEDEEEPEVRGNGFAVIHDSDDGRLDGNSRWDRAVGPMQFIPETWAYWETDGNGDGVADPQNLYDAAATAGRFLCHLSRTRGSSPYDFVLGYNASDTYVRNVMAVADSLGASALPTISD